MDRGLQKCQSWSKPLSSGVQCRVADVKRWKWWKKRGERPDFVFVERHVCLGICITSLPFCNRFLNIHTTACALGASQKYQFFFPPPPPKKKKKPSATKKNHGNATDDSTILLRLWWTFSLPLIWFSVGHLKEQRWWRNLKMWWKTTRKNIG